MRKEIEIAAEHKSEVVDNHYQGQSRTRGGPFHRLTVVCELQSFAKKQRQKTKQKKQQQQGKSN